MFSTNEDPNIRDADTLTLWKVSIPNNELPKTHRYFDIEAKGTKLSPLSEIQDVFPGTTPADTFMSLSSFRQSTNL
ncbi:hypothetical protein BC937DRAFT_92772 [Endogone sp. FLAS-F59071]|nr:hypothetical protein BC937DRAFT_92772 [Endogone sp. FLAS-F59071]|eukprot:RUS15197.1 hypothetical protein BC937DRAFT_92772 [Endogone sp. FLAS-F59071]